jgi:tryptophan halogenase
MDFMRATDALPKHSIRFVDWAKTPGAFDSPLESSVSFTKFLDDRLFFQILNDRPIEYASFSGILSLNEKTSYKLVDNKLVNTKNHAFQFDESKVGKFLKQQSINKGVNYIDDTITDVEVVDGKVSSVKTKVGRSISADIFIDCSGFQRLLIKQLGAKFVDVSKYIHVNAATIFEVSNDPAPAKTVVSSIARNYGWNFEIPSRHRIGRGYVHNADIRKEDDILAELVSIYGQGVYKRKTIKWTPGYLEDVWIGNVIAVGISACMLEPLNAGTIHDAIIQIKDLVETDLLDTDSEASRKSYNYRCRRLFNDYLNLQSVSYSGGREDTEFWKFVKYDQKLTDRAQHLLELAETRLTRHLDFEQWMGYVNHGYYNYALAGLGKFNKDLIRTVFDANRIDTQLLAQQQSEFEQQQLSIISECLTSQELNTILQNESLP